MATQALAALLASVALIGKEVGETAEAIRNHVNSDSGISANVLNEAADRLSAAAAQLDTLQAELGGTTDAGSSGEQPAPAGPAVEQPAPGTESAPPVDGELPFGNQSGVGSEFETGDPADGSGLGDPADGSGLGDGSGDGSGLGEGGAESGTGTDAGLGEPGSDAPAGDGSGLGDGSDGRQG